MISVVIPAYNAESAIEKTVLCVLKQSYRDFEVIIVDDGSTDRTYEICNSISEKDGRVKVIRKENNGVSIARNVGIEYATGEYLVFCDSDDFWEIDYLDKMKNCCNDKKSIPVCEYYVEYSNRVRTSAFFIQEGISWIDSIIEVFKSGHFNQIWNKMYDLNIIHKYKITFDEKLSLGEDFFFNFNYVKHSRYKFVPIYLPLYHYNRMGNETLDHKYHKDFFEIQKEIFETFADFCIKNGAVNSLNILYCMYFNALVVAVDNLYLNKNAKLRERKANRQLILFDHTFDKVINNLSGGAKIIYRIRLCMLRHGLYKMDYWLRECIKRFGNL